MDKVEHDFSAIEQALKQNEAPMRMRERIGKGGMIGLVTLASGIAITLAALGIGKGIYWAKEEKIVEVEVPVEKIVEKIVEVPVPAPAPQVPQVPDLENGTKVVRNYVIFQSVDIDNNWRLEAGHEYESSEQASYNHAWCHARGMYDGMDVTVGLSEKTPGGVITSRLDQAEARRIGLTKSNAEEWLSLCPFL